MKKNITISILVLITIILSAYLAKYYLEYQIISQNWNFKEQARKEQQIMSMGEIKNYFGDKKSIPANDLIITISDFRNNTYYGGISISLNTGKPESRKIDNFYLSKKNGVIFSEEANGEFNCKSLIDKGFDLSTVESMGAGCYISE